MPRQLCRLQKGLVLYKRYNTILQFNINLYIEKSAEHHLHQILPLLWAYQGYLCLKTGFRIGFYFKKFQTKYPSLMDQWFDLREIWCKNSIEARIKVYCSIIKKINLLSPKNVHYTYTKSC